MFHTSCKSLHVYLGSFLVNMTLFASFFKTFFCNILVKVRNSSNVLSTLWRQKKWDNTCSLCDLSCVVSKHVQILFLHSRNLNFSYSHLFSMEWRDHRKVMSHVPDSVNVVRLVLFMDDFTCKQILVLLSEKGWGT